VDPEREELYSPFAHWSLPEVSVPELKRTPFYDFHLKAGARMVDFAGWEMPLLYHLPGGGGGIIAEHEHTRTAASIFDVSHMGRLKFTGKDALEFLNRICTRNLTRAAPGQCMYSLVCNEDGGILDDVIVTRFDKYWYMVCNASNREKLLRWFHTQATKQAVQVKIEDETLTTAMVAVQGPKAVGLLDDLLPDPVSDMPRYHGTQMRFMLVIGFQVFRSGYTGEDGAELVCGLTAAAKAAEFLMRSDKKEPHPILRPAGLGARDTLRLEAGMPLYGHELNEAGDPLSADLSWAVDLQKDFIGAEPLRKIQAAGLTHKLVGLFIDGPRAARQEMPVVLDGTPVGKITSGAMSPTLKRCIAMAYVRADLTAPGTALTIECRGTPLAAAVTPLPFYKRPKAK
jgi:aminomethyltransferase